MCLKYPFCTAVPVSDDGILLAIQEIICADLQTLGVSPKLKGVAYLCAAVETVLVDPDSIFAVMRKLYPRVAAKYGTTSRCVERDIREVISKIWIPENDEYLKQIFLTTREKAPTVSDFIAIFAYRCMAVVKKSARFSDDY